MTPPATKALVTGGAGFIGSHLVDALLARGDSVIVLDTLTTGRYGNVSGHVGNPRFALVHGSVLNADLVDDLVARADVVYHLAAAVGVRLIVEQPLESLITNIRGSEILLEKAHKHGRKVLLTSTSEIYGKSPIVPMREDSDRLSGRPRRPRSDASPKPSSRSPARLRPSGSCQWRVSTWASSPTCPAGSPTSPSARPRGREPYRLPRPPPAALPEHCEGGGRRLTSPARRPAAGAGDLLRLPERADRRHGAQPGGRGRLSAGGDRAGGIPRLGH